MSEDQILESRKAKILRFLKKKNNIILLFIVLIGFLIRLYYFSLTVDQAYWYDESEYLTYAKHWALNVPYDANPQRPPLFPLIISIFYLLGLNEAIIKFFVVLLPSTLIILISYLLVKEMYDEKIALISAFLMAVFWLLIFNTMRMHTDALFMLLIYIAIYFFWKGYVKEKKNKYIIFVGIFLALAFMVRLVGVLTAAAIILFLLATERLKPLKDKYFWFSGLVGLLTVTPYLIYNQLKYGTIFAFTHGYSTEIQKVSKPFAWDALSAFNWYFGTGNSISSGFNWFYEQILFLIFLVGLLTLFNLFIGFDLLLKNKDEKLKSDFFTVLHILIYFMFFIFVIRGYDDRWLMPTSLFIFIITAKGIDLIYSSIKNYSKYIAIGVVGLILLAGAFFGLQHADFITKIKVGTYSQEPPAGKWLKEHTNKSDIIFSNNEATPFTFYSERKVTWFNPESELLKKIKEMKPKYYVVSIYYPSDQWTYEFPQKYSKYLRQVQVFFEVRDNGEKIPAVGIYEFIGYDLEEETNASKQVIE